MLNHLILVWVMIFTMAEVETEMLLDVDADFLFAQPYSAESLVLSANDCLFHFLLGRARDPV